MRLHWIWLHLLSISVMPRHGWQRSRKLQSARLVAMDDVSDMTVNKVAAVTEEMKKLTEQADAFAGGLSRMRCSKGLNRYDRDIFLLKNGKPRRLSSFRRLQIRASPFWAGRKPSWPTLKKSMVSRLGGLTGVTQTACTSLMRSIVATEDLGRSISNVIDLSDYLAGLRRQRGGRNQ